MADGLIITLEIFFLTLILSIPLGIIVSIGRLSEIKFLFKITEFYIWVMRGTPLMLQIVFIFFGLPIVGIAFDRFTAVLIAFVLNYGAYFGEIFRGGMESIDKGQYEAAKVLGLTSYKTFIRIILPQMFKVVLPSIANEVITLVKDTSLVYVVGIGELLRAGKIASNRDVSLIPLALVGIIYLLLTAIFTEIFNKIEKRYSYYE
ncbi:amino acid ABC transporter permease [Anaerosalibacter bizertensis]|uniref:amino acid ABC transporter permease n=1 Tax=Anaerosalibacter bizertensis TaxID=932217 RepID=UPI001C0E9F76|nr:amino acid ABC transporter permease [Anaerosalibacter bizertensis]MBU5294467.1 amino acid ABC transporter permease [Anaerosalibacter bizertensis]